MDRDSKSSIPIADEYEFEDSEISKQGGDSFKDVVLNQFNKCRLEGSKEMTKGGLMKRVIDNKIIEIPVPNQVEIYSNSVYVLKRILNTKLKENEKIIGKRMKQFVDTNINNLKMMNTEKNRLINPGKQEELLRADIEYQKYIMRQIANIDQWFEQEQFKNIDYLFETLGILIDHLKYFEEAKRTM